MAAKSGGSNDGIQEIDTKPQEKLPTYGLQKLCVKEEAPNDEEEKALTQIVYRCPHKRGEGGRCRTKETDLNLLLNHFYKFHARERLLTKSTPKFAMCCFRENCPSKFQNHKELVEHMLEHDNDPAENIYFTEYIKTLYEKESNDLGLAVKELSESLKDLKEELKNAQAEKNILQTDISKIKEMNELKIQNKDLEIKMTIKDLSKQEVEIKEITKDKEYYRDKYHSEKKKNKEYKAEIEEHKITIKKQEETIDEKKDQIKDWTIKLNLKDARIKKLEATVETSPTSTTTNINENSISKEVEEKDKKIRDMKRKEKILKKQVLELNKELLNLRLKNSCLSSDSDESASEPDEPRIKNEKHKNSNNPGPAFNEGKNKRGHSHSSFDESPDTEKRNRQKKKIRFDDCSQSNESNTLEQEYVEES